MSSREIEAYDKLIKEVSHLREIARLQEELIAKYERRFRLILPNETPPQRKVKGCLIIKFGQNQS